MADKKKPGLDELSNLDEITADTTSTTLKIADKTAKPILDKAVIDYTLELIAESKTVNSAEKHKITEEIIKLYAVIKRVPVVDGLQARF